MAVTGCTPSSPTRFMPIRRFVCRGRRGSLGSPRFGYCVTCFQARSPQLFSPSYRLSQKRPFASHPSVRQLLLGAPSLRTTPLAGLSTRAAPTRGFGPRHDITNPRPRIAKASQASLRSVLRRSQPLDGLLRKFGLQACFIPQPCPGPILFRGSFSSRSRTISSIV